MLAAFLIVLAIVATTANAESCSATSDGVTVTVDENGVASIPDTWTSVPDNAFRYCSTLSIVNFTGISKVIQIGDYAFANCPNLSSTGKLPESVTSIGDYAYSNTPLMRSMQLSGSKVTSIGMYAFKNSGLGSDGAGNADGSGSFFLPGTIVGIGMCAFENNPHLKELEIYPGDNPSCAPVNIGYYAFKDTGITTIALPPNSVNSASVSTTVMAGCESSGGGDSTDDYPAPYPGEFPGGFPGADPSTETQPRCPKIMPRAAEVGSPTVGTFIRAFFPPTSSIDCIGKDGAPIVKPIIGTSKLTGTCIKSFGSTEGDESAERYEMNYVYQSDIVPSGKAICLYSFEDKSCQTQIPKPIDFFDNGFVVDTQGDDAMPTCDEHHAPNGEVSSYTLQAFIDEISTARPLFDISPYFAANPYTLKSYTTEAACKSGDVSQLITAHFAASGCMSDVISQGGADGVYQKKYGEFSCTPLDTLEYTTYAARTCTGQSTIDYSMGQPALYCSLTSEGYADTTCTAGKIRPSTCPAGSYSVTGAFPCTFCSAGEYSSGNTEMCKQCPKDTYYPSSGGAKCLPCPNSSFPEGATQCDSVAPGTNSGPGTAEGGSSTGAILGGLFGAAAVCVAIYFYMAGKKAGAAAAAAAAASGSATSAPTGNPMQSTGNPMMQGLPNGWQEKTTVEGKTYFHNEATGETQEIRPTV